MDPSLVADKEDNAPRKPPIGVRATPTTHTSVKMVEETIKMIYFRKVKNTFLD